MQELGEIECLRQKFYWSNFKLTLSIATSKNGISHKENVDVHSVSPCDRNK